VPHVAKEDYKIYIGHIVLAAHLLCLLRNMRLPLAVARTEKHEKQWSVMSIAISLVVAIDAKKCRAIIRPDKPRPAIPTLSLYAISRKELAVLQFHL